MTETDSSYFKVISPSDVGHKVAPGMDKVFILQFTADQKKVQTGWIIFSGRACNGAFVDEKS